MARDVETILGLLGITDDNITYDMLITKLKTTNTLTDDELNNIMNISVKPLPTVVRNQPDMIKQKMYGIVTDENLGLTAVLNKRFVLFQSLIEILKKNIDLNQENIELSLQDLKDSITEETLIIINDIKKQINDILNGTKSVAHAIDAETAQVAIYDANGNEIIDYYAKLVDLQNHLAEYSKHIQEFTQHAETARKYFEGDVAIPKAIADKYGNDIPSTYATHLDVQMTFDSLNQHLEEINPYFNGTKAMPKAEKDRNGNTIDLTYATISSLNAVLNDIAAIKTVLTSNDTDLDTLQELVNALKNNVASIGDLFLQIGYKANKADVFTKQEIVDLIDSKLGDIESLLEAI